MRLASWNWGGSNHVGTISACGSQATALHLPASQQGVVPLIEMLVAGQNLPKASGPSVAVQAITLQAPIPRPMRNIFCIGRNYREHAKELATSVFLDNKDAEENWPIVFSKVPETVVGPYDNVKLPGKHISEQIDYESELAVIIGLGGRDISRSRAMDHVFGYTVINDVTARDVQMRHKQWHLGKSFDTFCPMGPWIVTADELDGRNTFVRGWVNGELRQEAPTTDLIFDIPALIETCSRGITLKPGDVIATGTCAGVGMGFNPPRWLEKGDVVKVQIDGIGFIENRFQ
jgi:2-keto-4-pentenoate hydratase/2-oxohepta-3-ene-1,7-dioic acid hydratase in catechol pathway